VNAHVATTNLSKRFGAATVLDRVDLAVERGALVTLLGPSGCGKTTLLRLIAGLMAPDEGSIAIGGLDVTRTPPHKRNVGVVFQSYALFPHLTVAGNVGFGLQGKGLGRAKSRLRCSARWRSSRWSASVIGRSGRCPAANSSAWR
jgi:putative spermidine/putrescine transport system ATP-binding protein